MDYINDQLTELNLSNLKFKMLKECGKNESFSCPNSNDFNDNLAIIEELDDNEHTAKLREYFAQEQIKNCQFI